MGSRQYRKPFIFQGFLREHETGFEPATLALARRYSTTEPLVQNLLCCHCISDKTYDTGKRYICQQIFFIFQIFSLSFRISRLPTYILFGKSFSRMLSSFWYSRSNHCSSAVTSICASAIPASKRLKSCCI